MNTRATPPSPAGLTEDRQTVSDALMDSQYLAGAKAGWNASQADDPKAAYAELVESRSGHLAGFKEASARLTANASQPDRVVEVLREALEPFAKLADEAEAQTGVTSVSDGAVCRMLTSMGDLRRARNALSTLDAKDQSNG